MSACVHCPMISYMSVALLPTGYWDGQWARVVHTVNFRIIHFLCSAKSANRGSSKEGTKVLPFPVVYC